MKIFIIQSNIAGEQLTVIFTQILMSTVHKQSFCLKNCFFVGNGFFFFEYLFFCFYSITENALTTCIKLKANK